MRVNPQHCTALGFRASSPRVVSPASSSPISRAAVGAVGVPLQADLGVVKNQLNDNWRPTALGIPSSCATKDNGKLPFRAWNGNCPSCRRTYRMLHIGVIAQPCLRWFALLTMAISSSLLFITCHYLHSNCPPLCVPLFIHCWLRISNLPLYHLLLRCTHTHWPLLLSFIIYIYIIK